MLTPTSFATVMVGVSFHDVATMASDDTNTVVSVSSSNPDDHVILTTTPTTFTATGAYSDIFPNNNVKYIPHDQPSQTVEKTLLTDVPSTLGSLYSYTADPRHDIIVRYTVTFSDGTTQVITHDIEHNYDPNRLLLIHAVKNGDY